MGTLTINFRGICTHFWGGIIPGVQHRVVLVEAAQIRSVVIVANGAQTADWLMPHVPTIQPSDSQPPFNAQPMLQNGFFTMGSRLTVPNGIAAPDGIDGRVQYKNFEAGVFSVAGFTDNYAYSTDVVLAGRAAVYLDLFNGTVEASPPGPGVVVTVTATVNTDGLPTIRVSPFLTDSTNPIPDQLLVFTQPEVSVTLANSCFPANSEGAQSNDYLYHLLTARGGLPRFVNPPQPKLAPPQTSPEVGLKNLRATGFPLSLQSPPGGGGPGTTESCSDSRYP